ncbi:hypothetical protein AJ78_08585 [Emergomyces pasteurianus Ep9510]|uniref:Uncharacterized protein n=1 Tax=Emergomyces pasteurianus Ep9510 TaxID=1447872 RepID=A0A1J9Q5F3_9EURO|nr:hypothetical protein AJ78_08585 [Emergomyces pasteurianus Ep9510]
MKSEDNNKLHNHADAQHCGWVSYNTECLRNLTRKLHNHAEELLNSSALSDDERDKDRATSAI